MNIKVKNTMQAAKTWCGMEIASGEYYTIQDAELSRWQNDSSVLVSIASGDLLVNDFESDIEDVATAINYLKGIDSILKTDDSRPIVTVNRIPLGHTICPTGRADHIVNGTYGNGTILRLDANTPSADLQFLGHWYGVGGRIIWESATLDDECSAILIAPATTGLTQATGDFNKVNLGGPYNVIVPAAPGTGAWSMDLTAKRTNTQILKAVPVPVAGNVGFFDYDSESNILTPNYTQTGGYNLYDFPVNLFRFCNTIFGRKQDGAESAMESSDVVGKLLFNSWLVRFTLSPVTQGVRCGVIVTTAVKRNI